MTAPPFAAAEGAAEILTVLFGVLLAAKVGEELARRGGVPGIVGMLVAGVLVGPSGLGLVDPGDVLLAFSELGVVFLLFWVGLETRLSDMRAVGRTAVAVGFAGYVVPLATGIVLGVALGREAATSVFLGAALVATSVGITSAVLIELGVTQSRASRTILGAAVVDDVLALLTLSVAEAGAGPGGIDPVEIAVVLTMTAAFLTVFAVWGSRLARQRPHLLQAPRFSQAPLFVAVLLCLGLAALAAQIGLAAIIGAFLAGMILAETRDQHPLEREVAPLYAFFPPFFFAFVGMQVDLEALAEGGALALLAGLTALAVVSKYVGARLGARGLSGIEARFVGVGMVPRGEVGIIVAEIGRGAGVLDERTFAAIVGMSVLTTLVVPPVLRRLTARAGEGQLVAA